MAASGQNLKNSPIANLPQLEIIRQPKGPDGSVGFSNHPLKKYVLVIISKEHIDKFEVRFNSQTNLIFLEASDFENYFVKT